VLQLQKDESEEQPSVKARVLKRKGPVQSIITVRERENMVIKPRELLKNARKSYNLHP